MDFTSIHNFYEHLVIDYLQSSVIPNHEDQPTDFFLDIAHMSPIAIKTGIHR